MTGSRPKNLKSSGKDSFPLLTMMVIAKMKKAMLMKQAPSLMDSNSKRVTM
jgi:hypothetical protein